MKICFLARNGYDKFSTDVFNEIKKNHDESVEGHFITSNKRESKFVQEKCGEDNVYIYEVSAFFKEHWEEFTFNKFVEYETKYECEPLWKYIYTDRFLINRDYDYCVRITVGYFMYYESIFSKNKIDIYFDETIATLQSYLAYIVGRKYGVEYLSMMITRGSINCKYHYFINDPFQLNMCFPENYKELDYSDEEKNAAQAYLKEYEEYDVKPQFKNIKTKPRIDRAFLEAPLRYLYLRLLPDNNDPYFYMYYQQYGIALGPIKRYINYQRCKKYYHKADYTKKYIYYPLHYQPEASTLVCAEKYEKQLFYIDSWAKSLPADTLLYVKEHYTFLGHRSLDFYKELKKYPNVVLIDPWESSRELIKHSVAVTTLTGTAGWEAMLLRKPVFLGGRIFYENAPGIMKVEDAFGAYKDFIKDWKKPGRDEVIQYLCAFFRSIREGNVYVADEDVYTDENMQKVTNSFYKKASEVINARKSM